MPVLAAGTVGTMMGALYTGRGPVCGITTRRAGNAGVGDAVWVCPTARLAGAGSDSVGVAGATTGAVSGASTTAEAAIVAGAGVSTTGGGGATGSLAATGTGATVGAGFLIAAGSGALGCASRGAGGGGGLTTTVTAGGATATAGRAGTAAPAGALATTAPAGGCEAMAGAEAAGVTNDGPCRGWGTILRGSGRAAGAAGGAATATTTAGGGVCNGVAGRAGIRPRRSASSFSFCLAWMAFSTSPGLEICERSILG